MVVVHVFPLHDAPFAQAGPKRWLPSSSGLRIRLRRPSRARILRGGGRPHGKNSCRSHRRGLRKCEEIVRMSGRKEVLSGAPRVVLTGLVALSATVALFLFDGVRAAPGAGLPTQTWPVAQHLATIPQGGRIV